MSNRQVVVEFTQDFVDGKVGLDVLGAARVAGIVFSHVIRAFLWLVIFLLIIRWCVICGMQIRRASCVLTVDDQVQVFCSRFVCSKVFVSSFFCCFFLIVFLFDRFFCLIVCFCLIVFFF